MYNITHGLYDVCVMVWRVRHWNLAVSAPVQHRTDLIPHAAAHYVGSHIKARAPPLREPQPDFDKDSVCLQDSHILPCHSGI